MLKKIACSQLRLGMFVHEFCGSWVDHPFWRSKFVLGTDAQLQKILQSGVSELWIDTDKGLDLEGGATEVEVKALAEAELERFATMPAPLFPSVNDNVSAVEEASRLIQRSMPRITSMFADARLGKALDLPGCESLVSDICESVIAKPDALISVARLKRHDEYTYMHSVAVCALMVGLGRQLGLNERLLMKVGLAGMLHDVGKAVMPLGILNRPGKLSDAEFEVMRTHAVRGHELLTEGGGVGPVVLDVCLHHHERVDGTGYPHRLSGDRISAVAKMGAICDVYDAVTSDRPYKKGWSPAESLRQMVQWKGHFDTKVFQAFVRTVGIYPTGSLVRLRSGRLAVVAEQNHANLLAPRVKAFFNLESNVRVFPRDVDLADPAEGDAIVGFESPSDWRFNDLDELCGLKPAFSAGR
ncbi:cyclic di-GMP phosphodiesterase [Pseudorhodoferax aquiterrae]|uniref:Cyclic di-GMP phosphodiesterase n=1 Tax=Pseudorhodoferax aquiterrae TaxID=747304 RepID=A0ABQ3G959_9BURK|nr:HD-GYP domain-containing protein [Pseudorhodoferax aquiterrae]GHC98488.1 cyclic di-GMP phosphodiesterase [Pseudorhodoferax aquiterrae]